MDNTVKPSPWGHCVRKQQRAGKREAVLRTAARLFSEKGYHGTSLELVAEELEITRPTVYYYFRNKDEILFECVRISLQMIENAASEVTRRGGSASERLKAVMRQYAEVITMDFGMCLVRVGDTPLPPQSRFKLRKMQANIDRTFREIIADGIKDKSFVDWDPKFASFAVAGALDSIARWYRADGEFGSADCREVCRDTHERPGSAHPVGTRAPPSTHDAGALAKAQANAKQDQLSPAKSAVTTPSPLRARIGAKFSRAPTSSSTTATLIV